MRRLFLLGVIVTLFFCVPVIATGEDLRGTWEVTAGIYKGTWIVGTEGTSVFGASKWDCCPSFRIDKLSGSIIGNKVEITRHIVAQESESGTQLWIGHISGNTVSGSWSGLGGSGSWSAIIKR